jgi:hypothetical protein
LQLRVKAYDNVYPNNFVTATVSISVLRNEFAPVFFPSPITVTIEETRPLGDIIAIVNATDGNRRVRCQLFQLLLFFFILYPKYFCLMFYFNLLSI